MIEIENTTLGAEDPLLLSISFDVLLEAVNHFIGVKLRGVLEERISAALFGIKYTIITTDSSPIVNQIREIIAIIATRYNGKSCSNPMVIIASLTPIPPGVRKLKNPTSQEIKKMHDISKATFRLIN